MPPKTSNVSGVTNGWSLDDGVKAAETTPDLYRFKVAVKPHSTEKLEIRERGPEFTQVSIAKVLRRR